MLKKDFPKEENKCINKTETFLKDFKNIGTI